MRVEILSRRRILGWFSSLYCVAAWPFSSNLSSCQKPHSGAIRANSDAQDSQSRIIQMGGEIHLQGLVAEAFGCVGTRIQSTLGLTPRYSRKIHGKSLLQSAMTLSSKCSLHYPPNAFGFYHKTFCSSALVLTSLLPLKLSLTHGLCLHQQRVSLNR
jgi:hypothetical protein